MSSPRTTRTSSRRRAQRNERPKTGRRQLGPLISLASVGRIEVLDELFGDVRVPPAVQREVVTDGAGLPGSRELSAADWVIVDSRDLDQALLAVLREDLGAGEAEAIALARAAAADLVLLDDGKARRLASRLGLPVNGDMGRRSKYSPEVRERAVRLVMVREGGRIRSAADRLRPTKGLRVP